MALSRTGSKLFAKPQTYTRSPFQPPSQYGQTPVFRSRGWTQQPGTNIPAINMGANSTGGYPYTVNPPEHYMDSWGAKSSQVDRRRMFQQTSPSPLPGQGRLSPMQPPVPMPGSSQNPANWSEWGSQLGQNLQQNVQQMPMPAQGSTSQSSWGPPQMPMPAQGQSSPGRRQLLSQQNPMGQGPVNLSGMQGTPTAQGMGIAGMIPGFGGMAAQGYMAALGKGYQAAQSRVGGQMGRSLPGQGQAVRGLNAITDTPQPQSSLQAAAIAENNPMMNQSVAGMSNGYYSPPSSVNQGREYGLTLPMDLAGQQNRNANQNPMYEGMQDQFGPGSGVGQQAAFIAQNEAAGNVRIPGSYGEMPTYVEKRESPEVKYRSNKNGDQVSYVDNNDPVLRRQFNALRNFTPNAERGANRKAAREATKARLADSRFKMMVDKGMNPNSPKAKAMFPEQTGGGKLNPNNPMAPAGPPGSLESQMEGTSKVAEDLSSNPHLTAIGATPESTLQDINTGFSQHLATDGTFSDESLKAYQDHAKAQDKTRKGDYNPFAFSSATNNQMSQYEGGLWHDLANLPDTPEARKSWLDRYKSRDADLKKKLSERSGQVNQDYPPVNPFPSLFSGGMSF